MVNKNMNNSISSFVVILSISIMIFSIYIFSIFLNEQKTLQRSNAGKGNMFYIEVVNYVLPVYKVTSFDDEDMAESTFSVKNAILNYVGINLNQPKETLKKEIACLKVSNNSMDYNSNDVTSFNLRDPDITKNTGDSNTDNKTNNTDNNTNVNLPSQTFQVFNPKLKNNSTDTNPEILIYHSHTTESYGVYGHDNLDPTKNVCAVGDELAKTLSDDHGISVIHDTTIHNATDYNGSYMRSRQTLNKYLSKYGSFKMIIDLHRDSDPDKDDVTTNINGENLGKFMFVMTRKNPHFDKNMIIVNSLINTAKKNFPQLMIGNGIYYYDYGMNFFNQDESNNAFLLEVGSVSNTLNEAKGTTKYIARAIAEYINGK